MGFQKSPSSFTRSQSEEHVESFGPSLLQKHNVNHVMCVSLSKFILSFRKKQKKKKKEKKRKTSYSSQYIIWTIFGTWKFFCEGKWSIELLISLKKDFIFSSSYYIVLYPTVCTFFFRDICRLVSLKKDFIFSSSYHIMLYPTVCTFSFRELCRF